MSALSIILSIVLILISLVLIAAVLMQQGQRQGLGAIAGGADTFFGKNKTKGLDAKLAKITKIAVAVFVVLAIAATIVVSHVNNSADVDAAANPAHGEEGHVHVEGDEVTEEATEEVTEEVAAEEAAEVETEEAATEEATEETTEEATAE